MAFTIDAVKIANDALTSLGASVISSLDETTKQANFVNTFFDLSRRFVLSQYPWPFAKTQVPLVQTGTSPLLDRWTYEYTLPANMITLLEVVGSRSEYDLQQNLLLSNANTVDIFYIQDVETIPNWSTGFVAVHTAYLTFKLSFPLTQSASAKQRSFNEYLSILAEVKGNESQQKNFRVLKTSGNLTRNRGYDGVSSHTHDEFHR